MSNRAAGWLAWSLSGLAAAFGGLSLLLMVFNREVHVYEYWLADAIIQITFPLVGTLIVSRYPANALGWVFCMVGLSLGTAGLASQYATYTLLTEPGALPGGVMMAWLGAWIDMPGFISLPLILLLFPDGRLPSRRWRPLAWLIPAMIAITAPVVAFTPGPLDRFPSIDNPLGIEAARALSSVQPEVIFAPFLMLAWLSSALAVVLRLRRSRGIERQQLKWFTFTACLLPISFLGNEQFPELAWLIGGIAASLIPISIGITILRYRLYDIDVIINRTLVYGVLTLTLAVVYIGSVLLLQRFTAPLVGQDSQLGVVTSTLVIAALFQPLRRRIQGIIDRRFYRRKYDSQRVLESFAARLQNETDLETLTQDMVSVVQETLQPSHVSLWLRDVKQKA